MASIVNRGTFFSGVTTGSRTASTTLSAGTNRKFVLAFQSETSGGAITVSAITYDGTSFFANQVLTRTSGDNYVVMYYYDIPDAKGAGSYNVVVTSTSGTNIGFAWWQLADCATGAAEGSGTANTTAGTTLSVTASATNGAVLIGAALSSITAVTWTIAGDVTEYTETAYTSSSAVWADAVTSGAGTKSMDTTVSTTGARIAALASFTSIPLGPTITVQPVADTVILSNETSATFSVTATGTGTLLYDWELEDGVGSGVYANLANGSGATWTGQASASCSAALTAKTLTGRRVRCNVTDDNGTTTSSAVALTIWDGPQLTTFPATDGDGESTATLTSDYVTGVGEAIEVRIPLSDGDVAVTVTTT
jgi:hypothetical protein